MCRDHLCTPGHPVVGDRMFISNATGCSSIWATPPPRLLTRTSDGHSQAWNNSLFEDNAEHGLGMMLGYEAVRKKVNTDTEDIIATEGESDELGSRSGLDRLVDAVEASKTTAAAYVEELEKIRIRASEAILADKLPHRKSRSGSSAATAGLRHRLRWPGHVLASGHNVNVFVFDTEVYSNTGGQASKASNIGQVAQFAAAGKVTKKKSLAEIAMSYGYVYVAQVAMGANPAQTLKAIHEAEAYARPVAHHRLQPLRDALH